MGRKWLKTNLTNAGMPREPLETLLAHKLNTGTDDNYYMTNEDHLKSIYLKYLPQIAINPIETLTLESDEFKLIKEENKALKETVDKQAEVHRQELAEMKVNIDENQTNIENLMRQYVKNVKNSRKLNRENDRKDVPFKKEDLINFITFHDEDK